MLAMAGIGAVPLAVARPLILFFISIVVNIGMWLERFVIVVTSLRRDFLPSSWGYYTPTWVDWGMLLGSFGLFFTFCLQSWIN